VQLPDWTCPNVVRELIRRFDKYLHIEIDEMYEGHKKDEDWKEVREKIKMSGHKHTPSMQSVSSALTDSSQCSDRSNASDIQDGDLARLRQTRKP
jgi:ferredoxin-fold anticodon binding domain-containing protein